MTKKRPSERASLAVDPTTSPAYIVDLPLEDPEAALAKSKFVKAVEGLLKAYPMISEARATVRVSSPAGERRRFEVQALVSMPSRRIEFAAEGWSLIEAFDEIVQKLKRIKTKPQMKPSYRKRVSRQERESRAATHSEEL